MHKRYYWREKVRGSAIMQCVKRYFYSSLNSLNQKFKLRFIRVCVAVPYVLEAGLHFPLFWYKLGTPVRVTTDRRSTQQNTPPPPRALSFFCGTCLKSFITMRKVRPSLYFPSSTFFF